MTLSCSTCGGLVYIPSAFPDSLCGNTKHSLFKIYEFLLVSRRRVVKDIVRTVLTVVSELEYSAVWPNLGKLVTVPLSIAKKT